MGRLEHPSGLVHPFGLYYSEWSGKDLRAAREVLGLTQAELAVKLGYTKSGLIKAESALKVRQVVAMALHNIATELGVSLDA